ncbi:MAG: class I SAM-dependent methyltransferase, partial [Alphaproteobacteria bacterium]
IGVDSSDSMIAAARRAGASKTSVSGTSLSKASPVRFECAKGEKLPFESAQYDLVFAKTILCFVDDAPAVFAEISRVLRPGDRLVIGELGTWSFGRCNAMFAGYSALAYGGAVIHGPQHNFANWPVTPDCRR